MRLPASSSLPSPAARTLPFCGFSLAVSGSTSPLAVVCSSSIACTIRRSPRGLSFMFWNLRLEDCLQRPASYGERADCLLALSGGECQLPPKYIEDLGGYPETLLRGPRA